ncbi:hypothetical protein N0V90_005584 [Kalmusia sp. IMI 367209]|nr:hypothetical protein N0V90_005584 [Kalmusia sp. IMI 367209]
MVATPIDFAPTQDFIGNDGSWSSFAVSVGTPYQDFRVFPATSSQETWVPVPEACQYSNNTVCISSRGAFNHLFQTNASTTWKEIGLYDLTLEKELGYQGNGIYGTDMVSLELSSTSPVKLENQIVAGIATNDFYVGLFGLGPRPVNFSNMEYPVPSFLGTLLDQATPRLAGSLTLGGYDESRIIPDGGQFPFNPDNPFSLFIQSITSSNSLKGRATLLDDSQITYVSIDSSIPHLWLPRDVCDRFEEAFGLKYDADTDLYLTGSVERKLMLSQNASITIGLGSTSDPTNRTNIVMPYAAFDLQATAPIYSNATHYFPIRRAANNTQYRLGRTFLQEAYIIADYERSIFAVHQARHQEVMPPASIIPILPKNETKSGEYDKPSSGIVLGKSELAGIVVGACVAAALCIAFAMFLYRRRKDLRRRRKETFQLTGGYHPHLVSKGLSEVDNQNKTPTELHDEALQEMSQPLAEICGAGKHPVLLTDDLQATLTELPTEQN